MGYRLTYTFQLAWVAPGIGPFSAPSYPGDGSSPGTGQVLGFGNSTNGQSVAGAGTGNIIIGTDVTTLTNAAAADMAAQLNQASNLALMQSWPLGKN